MIATCRVAAHPDLVALSGGQHTELIAIGIGHHHPADLALADVDSSRPEGDETVDLGLLITVDRWSEVEMQPVLACFRPHWRTAPRDLRTALRRANRGLLVLVPDQRPAQRLTPEVSDLLGTVGRKCSDESAVSKEVVARLDDAELIAFGVGEHHVTLLRALTDVDVPGAESERPRHRLLLVLEGRARQIEVHLVRAGLLLLGRQKSDPEPSVTARQECDAVAGVVGQLPVQDAGPEARETQRVVRIEAHREEVSSHPAPHLRSADPQPQAGHVLPAMRKATAKALEGCDATRISQRATLPRTIVCAGNVAHRNLVVLQVDVHPAGAFEHGPLAGDVRRRPPGDPASHRPRPALRLPVTGSSPTPRDETNPAPPLRRPLGARAGE